MNKLLFTILEFMQLFQYHGLPPFHGVRKVDTLRRTRIISQNPTRLIAGRNNNYISVGE
jgi:hypothetical protein